MSVASPCGLGAKFKTFQFGTAHLLYLGGTFEHPAAFVYYDTSASFFSKGFQMIEDVNHVLSARFKSSPVLIRYKALQHCVKWL